VVADILRTVDWFVPNAKVTIPTYDLGSNAEQPSFFQHLQFNIQAQDVELLEQNDQSTTTEMRFTGRQNVVELRPGLETAAPRILLQLLRQKVMNTETVLSSTQVDPNHESFDWVVFVSRSKDQQFSPNRCVKSYLLKTKSEFL
jgi:hypothetical protein